MLEEEVDSIHEKESHVDESNHSSEIEGEEKIQKKGKKARVNDRRRFNSKEKDDSTVEEEDTPSLVPSYVELLEKKVSIAEEKLQEHIAKVNKESKEFRTRQEKDFERRIQQVRKELFSGLLSIADDLSRANSALKDVPLDELDENIKGVNSLIQGFQMIQSRFFQELSSQGVQPIQSVGEIFDPAKHEAIRSDEVIDKELDGKILEELSVGYLLNDEILRPSRVAVGKYMQDKKNDQSTEK